MYPAKENYKGDKASKYDRRRTSSVIGRIEWRREFRLLSDFVAQRIQEGTTLLDAPTGTGRFIPMLRQLGAQTTGVDISLDMLSAASRRTGGAYAKLVLGDCEFLPFPNQAFDYVLSMRYMGHLPPSTRFRVLLELKRVSKRGIIVGFPVLNWFTALKYRIGNIVYRLRNGKERPWWPATTRSLADELTEAGLKVSDVRPLFGPFSQISILHLTEVNNA